MTSRDGKTWTANSAAESQWWAAAYATPDGLIGVLSMQVSPFHGGVVPVEVWNGVADQVRKSIGPSAILIALTPISGDIAK